jgi:hypothetical protein
VKVLKEFCALIYEEIIEKHVELLIPEAVTESSQEMMAAALLLFRSSVMDRCISEVLDLMIPEIAEGVKSEYAVIEFIDSRDLLFKEVFEGEMRRIVQETTLRIVAGTLVEGFLEMLPVEDIVQQAKIEEAACNREIVDQVGNHLVDCLVEEEWVEVLAEDEINSQRMEQIWKSLPPKLQKEVQKSQFPRFVEIISEYVYFDILNEVVGGVWVEGVVRMCLGEKNGELEAVMPVRQKTSRKLGGK